MDSMNVGWRVSSENVLRVNEVRWVRSELFSNSPWLKYLAAVCRTGSS